MLTPQEVSNHAFAKAVMGGYNMAMVDEFLDELTDDYTSLYKENAALKAKMKVLVDKVEEYRSTEDAMRAALLTAQKMALDKVGPGVVCGDLDKIARDYLDARYPGAFGHSLGHGVGIDIHELPNFNRSKNIIEVGSVITMEPGVYLPGVGGVRLEDYGVVTENGYEPFTKTPHDLHIIDC